MKSNEKNSTCKTYIFILWMVQYKRMDHQQYLLIFYIKKGTAITTALISLFTDQKVPTNLAMTGEISLNGEVCKIGKIFKIYSIGGL